MSAPKTQPITRLTARTPSGRIAIRVIVLAARKHGLLHITRPRNESKPPKHKLQVSG